MAAHRLVSPEQAVLREKKNAPVKFALRAADGRRLAGKHWLVLLGAPRESFGSARSERAQRVFEVLEEVVAEYVAPAVAGTTVPAEPTVSDREAEGVPAAAPDPDRVSVAGAVEESDGSGAVPDAEPDAVVPVEGPEAELRPAGDAPPEPAASSEASAVSSTSASAASGSWVRVETGAARGRLLAGADDQVWGEVPLHLRQSLRGVARQLVTPVRGVLREPGQRRVLSAVRAAERMRISGAYWVLLMTTGREAFGSSGSAMAGAFYGVLEQILAEYPPLTRAQGGPAEPEEGEAG
ncbi:hypothetical protein [Streptomyces sp. NPDC048638]|uniref:hypothetical protein n=1 Tax=Streptomyces sp. NPDC048638 TaxID=3365580 RepID=UPI003716639E